MKYTSGHIAVEVIVSVAILTIFVSSAIVLSLRAQGAYMRDAEVFRAEMYLEQGIEAVRALKNDTFANLAAGQYGLRKTNSYWEFFGTSDSFGKYTRTVTISDLGRGASCALVSSGGFSDSLSKKVVVSVTWDGSGGNQDSLSQTQYLTDWTNAAGCGSASYFTVDTSAVELAGSGKKVEGIFLANSASSAIVLDKIQMWWTNSAKIKKVKIDGNWVWRDNNEGTPDGEQSSGTILDIVDVTLFSGAGVIDIDSLEFNDDMSGATLSFLFLFTDGTGRYAEVDL